MYTVSYNRGLNHKGRRWSGWIDGGVDYVGGKYTHAHACTQSHTLKQRCLFINLTASSKRNTTAHTCLERNNKKNRLVKAPGEDRNLYRGFYIQFNTV